MSKILTVKDENFEMDYIVFGEGKKNLVIIPGISVKPVTDSAAFVENTYKCFKDDYTVYIFARTKNPDENYTVEQLAHDTVKALNIIGIKSTDLFGVSFGGMVCQIIAADFPNLINKLVLGSTLPKIDKMLTDNFNVWSDLAMKKELDALNLNFAKKLYPSEFYKKYSKIFVSVLSDTTDEQLNDFIIYCKSGIGFDMSERLKKIKCPTLVLGSEDDQVLSADGSRQIAKILGCEIYMYNGYGHASFDLAPDYKNRILNFLNK